MPGSSGTLSVPRLGVGAFARSQSSSAPVARPAARCGPGSAAASWSAAARPTAESSAEVTTTPQPAARARAAIRCEARKPPSAAGFRTRTLAASRAKISSTA